jgi:hypothetical protein
LILGQFRYSNRFWDSNRQGWSSSLMYYMFKNLFFVATTLLYQIKKQSFYNETIM